MVDIGASFASWVSFQYERLPIFCYWCRLLNHDEKDCKLWIRSKCTLRKEEQQYDAWLRSTMERLQSTHPGRATPNATVATSDTVTATMNGEPPANPAIIPTIMRDKGRAKTTVTGTHKHTPTNTETLNNHESFHSHPAVIDQHLKANDELAEAIPMITNDSFKAHARHEKPLACDVTTADATLLTSQGEPLINNGPNDKPIKAQHTQTAQIRRTWKRLSHDHAPNPKTVEVSVAGSKHKLDLIDGEDDDDKKQKLDNDTRILGKIFVKQLGSAMAVVQHRWVQ